MTTPRYFSPPLPEAQPHTWIAQSVNQAGERPFLIGDRITRSALVLMVLAHV